MLIFLREGPGAQAWPLARAATAPCCTLFLCSWRPPRPAGQARKAHKFIAFLPFNTFGVVDLQQTESFHAYDMCARCHEAAIFPGFAGARFRPWWGLPLREADNNADTARHKGNALNTTNAGGKAVLVTWQANYALGMAEIDEQHKMLFDIMSRLWDGIVRNARASEMTPMLDELERYTVMHFTEEETFMRSIGYPQIDAHVALHRRFVQKITEEKAKTEQGERTSLELLHFLRDWLVNHILVEDKRYVAQFHTEKRSTSLLGRFFARLSGA